MRSSPQIYQSSFRWKYIAISNSRRRWLKYHPLSVFAEKILEEEFGDMLLKSRVEGVDLDALPSPILLKKKILLKVLAQPVSV